MTQRKCALCNRELKSALFGELFHPRTPTDLPTQCVLEGISAYPEHWDLLDKQILNLQNPKPKLSPIKSPMTQARIEELSQIQGCHITPEHLHECLSEILRLQSEKLRQRRSLSFYRTQALR